MTGERDFIIAQKGFIEQTASMTHAQIRIFHVF